ncbi:hypothetical protein DL768_008251 [Monosporascus sp. mg162]|nr:hypothetical protein DL768_008251 [Monosporascus sp. mg162]
MRAATSLTSKLGLLILVVLVIFIATVGNAQATSPGNDTGTAAIAATTCGDGDIQLFHRDASNRFIYHLYVAGNWHDSSYILPVVVDPKPNTPLAGFSWQDSTSMDHIRLYYFGADGHIVEIIGSCVGVICDWDRGEHSLGNANSTITSGLAVVSNGNSEDLRAWIYYLNSASSISYTYYTGETGWQIYNTTGQVVSDRSSLAASGEPDGTNFQVTYVSRDSELSQISWTGEWLPGGTIDDSIGPDFYPALAMAITASPSSRRLYYINSSMIIEEWTYQNGAWDSQARSSPVLPTADAAGGPIAAVALTTGVRLYYVSGGNILEGEVDNDGQWSLIGNLSTTTVPETPPTSSGEMLTDIDWIHFCSSLPGYEEPGGAEVKESSASSHVTDR